EANEQNFERLALLEEEKALPWSAIYDYFCVKNGALPAEEYITEIQRYEKETLSNR
ncbi:MAG: L-rhamnose isomerase, partial [Prevotellaceae bacterium]|nr:L-rhamnose isomerase [Prevotellaceae bacterium]